MLACLLAWCVSNGTAAQDELWPVEPRLVQEVVERGDERLYFEDEGGTRP
jgi:hypothetical protein